MSMSMSRIEAEFVKGKILESPFCQRTLLSYLLEKYDLGLSEDMGYYDLKDQLDGLDSDIRDIYEKSVLFSKLIHLIDWSFNHAYYNSFNNSEFAGHCQSAFEELYQIHKLTLEDIECYTSLFDYIREIDPLLTDFCEGCYDTLRRLGMNALNELDSIVTNRERTVKRERSKIGNSAYRNQRRLDPGYNAYRWGTVRTMVSEIRNPQ